MAKVTLEGTTEQIIDAMARYGWCPVCRKALRGQRRRAAALKGWETRRKALRQK